MTIHAERRSEETEKKEHSYRSGFRVAGPHDCAVTEAAKRVEITRS